MPKPLLYLFRGEQAWMLSRDIPDDGECPTATPALLPGGLEFPRELEVEAALKRARAARPGYEIRVMNWHRPKQDV
jgi:hypothetical protein